MMGFVGSGRSSRIIFSGLQQFVSRRTFSKNQQRESPFGAKRFYHWGRVDNRADEFKGSRGRKRWMWNLESSAVLALLSGLVGLDVYFGSWDTVPYTKRRQMVTYPSSFEEDDGSGTTKYEKMKEDLASIILPPLHPDSVRVRAIAQGLVEAFQRKEGDARIKKTWEVLVVDLSLHCIVCSSGGKIVISTETLDSCQEDAEIAAFIATEVGRVVARHAAERISMSELLSSIFLLILHAFVTSKPSLWKFFRFPFARSLFYFVTWLAVARLLMKIYTYKMDVEADYIGLMLLASAGYDPRVALQAREKIIRTEGGSTWEKLRARRLVVDMEEALSIYREVLAEHDD